jgi:hypothetical protein
MSKPIQSHFPSKKNPTSFAWKSLRQSQVSPMFTLFLILYLESIEVAKGDGNSSTYAPTVRLKGKYHGHLLRHYAEYRAQDSAWPLIPISSGFAA